MRLAIFDNEKIDSRKGDFAILIQTKSWFVPLLRIRLSQNICWSRYVKDHEDHIHFTFHSFTNLLEIPE